MEPINAQVYMHNGNKHLYVIIGVGRHATNSEESDKRYVYYMNEQGELFDREVNEFMGLNDNGSLRFVLVRTMWHGEGLHLGI